MEEQQDQEQPTRRERQQERRLARNLELEEKRLKREERERREALNLKPQEEKQLKREQRQQRRREVRDLERKQVKRAQRKQGRRLARDLSKTEEIRPARWRWSDGRLTFFNLKRRRHVPPVVEVRPLEAEEIPSALVSRLRDPALPQGVFSGAVYRNDGHIMPGFLEHDELTQHRVSRRVNVPVLEGARMEAADRSYDTGVYLGRWSPQFGHFLLESLASAWYLTKVDRSIPLLFHSWSDRPQIPPFASALLDALDVQPSRIRAVSGRDLRVSRLIMPSSQFWQGIKASPGMCIAFDYARERMLQSRSGKGRTPEKVYLSRRAFEAERAVGKPKVVIRNEEEAETFFRSLGYEILQPEQLAFEEQVAIVANATHVAGPSGSALHLMLFNANPQAKLIELRTRPAINQLLISTIRGYEAFHISCRRKDGPSDGVTLDTEIVERAVREIG